ncbi:hypothetical protein MBLNU457_3672t1 [Dothideomycetes sp. NU457]
MPDFKSIAKGGWHPSWENKGPSINRDNYKNPRAWMSKGQDPAEAARNHESAPLSSLRDPASFAPPPKHSHYHGQQSASGSSSPASSSTALATTSRPPRPKPEMQSNRGLGAALTPQQLAIQQQQQEAEEEEAARPKPPPTPYRVDTTGLSTANLPKPPVRRADGTGSASPVTTTAPASRRPPPSLPPRLPPRQNEYPDEHTPAPPPSYGEAITDTAPTPAPNRGAIDRLGQAGVSVPGFGIGGQGRASPPKPPPRTGSSSPAQPASPLGHGGQMNELQSRFARLGSSSQSQTQSATAAQPKPSAGTSWADKRAALETARNAHRDPSSVSFADARSAVGTANNFRQRHGEAIAGGVGKINSMGVGFDGQSNSAQAANAGYDDSGSAAGAAAKKAPPPPPPKKKVLGFEGQGQNSAPPPPPVPMGSKPRFG